MNKIFRDTWMHCKKTVFASVFMELLQAVIAIAAAAFMGDFADALFWNNMDYAKRYLPLLILCILVNVLLVPGVNYLVDRICIRNSIQYSIYMFSRFLNMEYEKAKTIPAGEVKSRLESDVIRYRNAVILVVARLIVVPVSVIGVLYFMGRVGMVYMLVAGVLSLIVLILPAATKRLAAIYESEELQYQGDMTSNLSEYLNYAPYFKIYRLGKHKLSEYQNLFLAYFQKTMKKSVALKGIAENVSAMIRIFTTIVLILAGAVLNAMGWITTGDIVEMAGYYATLLTAMEGIGFVISRITLLKKLEGRMSIFYDYQETDDNYKADDTAKVGQPFIQAENVSITLDEKNILQKVSFDISSGEKVVVVGPNGSGKTTLLNILSGLYQSYEGSLKYYGREVKDWNVDELADSYSYVSQNSFVCDGTVLENVCFGNEDCSRSQAEEVMKQLGIYEMREHMICTQTGNLSGGECKRICLARALLRNKQLLIMDEPSNHLDADCMKWLIEYIKKCGKTLIYVTHDLKLQEVADKKIVLGK